jgi:xanthine dehydrogenase accessory factor
MKNSEGHWEIFDDYVLDFALENMRNGVRTAIVTLVEVDGSSPWRPGAQMAVTEAGQWVGYLSGGCIERAVAAEVCDAFAKGKSRRVRYGRGSPYLDIQLPCGSAIELVMDIGVTVEELARVDGRLRQRKDATLSIPDPVQSHGTGTSVGPFLRRYLPRRRLAVAGIGPVTVQLARLARTSGFDVLAAAPDAATLGAISDSGIKTLPIHLSGDGAGFEIDARTAVVLAFHDHEWETGLLPRILKSDAFYIGAMGSVRTHQLRIERLKADGATATAIGRIRSPAGVLSGTKGATDIAISILAEIVQEEARTIGPSLLVDPDTREPTPGELMETVTSLAGCPAGAPGRSDWH